MYKCRQCNTVVAEIDTFCSKCGLKLNEDPSEIPFVGESIGKARYRITFGPVEGTFDSKDAATEAARHSCWNDDDDFADYKVEFVETDVPVRRFPFICKGCREFVSPTRDGKCCNCSSTEWGARDE